MFNLILQILKLSFKNIYRNKRRTLLSVLAIGTAVFVVCFMKSYVTGMMDNFKKNIFIFESGHIKILNKNFLKEEKLMPLDLAVYDYQNLIEKIKNLNGIKYITPRIKFFASINLDSKMKNIIGFALDPEFEEKINPLNKKIIKGRLFKKFEQKNFEIVIGKQLADELKLDVGDKITIMSKTSEEGLAHVTLKIVGISSYGVSEFDKNFFFIDITTAQKFLQMENSASEIVIFLNNENDDVKIAENINRIFQKNNLNEYIAYPWKHQKDGQYYKIVVQLRYVYIIVYIIFLALGSFVIINTIIMTIYERIQEIGTISALGMKGIEIILLFLFEAIIISVIGSFWGTIGGGALSYFFSKQGINFAKLSGGSVSFQISEVFYPYFGIDLLLFSFLFGIIVSSLCSFIPSLRAAKIEPAEALRRIF